MLNRIFIILGGIFLMIVLAAAVGLGVWAYSLNTQLVQVRAEYRSLKNGNDKLTNAYNDLKTESTKTEDDLAAAQAQVENLQGQLKKAQEDDASLNTRLKTVQDKVSILYTYAFGTIFTFESKVDGSGDDQLQKLWADLKKNHSGTDAVKLLEYLIQSVADASGLSLSPTRGQNGSLVGLAV